MKLNKTQFDILSECYNSNKNTKRIINKHKVQAILSLCDKDPQLFYVTRLGYGDYNFTIKDLAAILSILNVNKSLESN